MTTSMKIGDLAKQTGISTRTLHYYDEIGLLSPSYRTESGHRLYAEQDIIRLQQIMSLRALRFSLDEIRECLENVTAFSLQQVIHLHQIRLQEQIALSHTLLSRLNAITRELQLTQSVSIEQLIQAMETITMSEQYFTPEQQAILEARFREGEAEWQELMTKVRAEMNKSTDLNSPSVQFLVRRWRSMMQAFIRGDRKIYESLVKMYQQEGIETASWRTLDPATFEYIVKADSFLTLAEEMKLAVSFEDFTPEAIQVIVLGQDAVRHLNLNFFGTEAILLGLLAEGTGIAAQVLIACGVNFQAIRHLIEQWTSSLIVTPTEVPAEIPFTLKACRVLELALDQTKLLNQAKVDTEHLLLGILKQGEETEGGGLAIRSLQESLRIDLAHLEQQLRSSMS